MCDDSQQELKEDDTSDKESKQQEEQDEMLQQNSLDQHESTSDLTKQQLCTLNDEGTEEREVVKTDLEDDAGLHSNHHHWKQDERMVLEAGSKAAEVAKSVFGK